jgi:phage terminase Nu1 subunit (DNA packaging protein)
MPPKPKKLSNSAVVSSGELAALFSCSTRTVSFLAAQGIAVRVGRGRYDRVSSVRGYVKHLREQAALRGGDEGAAANAQYTDAATKLLRLKLKRESAETIPTGLVHEGWAAIMDRCREFILAIPGQVAEKVPTLSVYERAAIERLCRDGLEDLALEHGFIQVRRAD